MTPMTRRLALAGVCAVPLATALPVRLALATPEPWRDRLQAALRTAMDGQVRSELTVLDYQERQDGLQTLMSAHVRLTWPPGIRQRRFEARDAVADEAYALMLSDILETFAVAGPAGTAS